MGVRLIREVLANAPEGLDPACRFVLVVLAESARDSTRRAYPGMSELVRLTGMSESSLGRVFRELAAWGLEVRVQIGTDRSGRPLFAARGHQTTYRIPSIADGKAPERSSTAKGFRTGKPLNGEDLSGEKGPQIRTERSSESPRKVLNGEGPSRQGPTVPFPSIPSKNYGGGAERSTHYARPDGVEPPPRCPDHIDDPTDAPCRACGTARKAWEAWASADRRARAAEESAAARRRAEATRAAINACDACDTRGRLPGDILCSHDPDAGRRRAQGAAAARAAINGARPPLRLIAEA